MQPPFFFHRKLRPVKEKASGMMRSSQKKSLLARGTKAVLPKQWLAGCAKHTFVLFPEPVFAGLKISPDRTKVCFHRMQFPVNEQKMAASQKS